MVDYIGDVLIDHLSGVTIQNIDRDKGTIGLVSSTGAKHVVILRRVM